MRWILIAGALLMLLDSKHNTLWHYVGAMVLVMGAVLLSMAEAGLLYE